MASCGCRGTLIYIRAFSRAPCSGRSNHRAAMLSRVRARTQSSSPDVASSSSPASASVRARVRACVRACASVRACVCLAVAARRVSSFVRAGRGVDSAAAGSCHRQSASSLTMMPTTVRSQSGRRDLERTLATAYNSPGRRHQAAVQDGPRVDCSQSSIAKVCYGQT